MRCRVLWSGIRDRVWYDVPPASWQCAIDMEKELVWVWEICQEVWNDIPIEDLRPYMTKTEERCKKIKDANGAWVGWGTGTTVRHGLSV